jgi:cellulose synthase/poly-beta-1,6-N-acetylglucosamine synthase-like glycosyltransferase
MEATFALIVLFWAAWGAVIYAYALFPVLLAGFARLFGRRDAPVPELPDEELPRVAMIVAAYNEAGTLPAKLANTWAIDYPADRFHLFIGSDGSDDGTGAVLEGCGDPRLRAFRFDERRGKISVLNDLVERAAEVDAEIVVMSDANTIFAPDSVRKLVKHFRDERVGCVSGELRLEQNGGVSGEGLYWKYECWIKRNESRLGFLIGCNGGIFALRRRLYRPLPKSTVVEDFVLTMRVLQQGFQVRLEPEARAAEPPCPSAHAEMVRKTRIGAGGFQALGLTWEMLHPRHGFAAFAYWGHKVLRWLAPLFLLTALGANLGLAVATAPPFAELYLALLALQLTGALVAARIYNTHPGAALPRWMRWLRPVSYFYLMNYALFCGFLRFLFRTQRVTWDRAAR